MGHGPWHARGDVGRVVAVVLNLGLFVGERGWHAGVPRKEHVVTRAADGGLPQPGGPARMQVVLLTRHFEAVRWPPGFCPLGAIREMVVHPPARALRGDRPLADTSSTQGADGHIGAHQGGGKQALAGGQWGMGNGGKTGRGRSCARGRNRAKIFYGNLENGQKDGHFGAHQSGDKRLLTGRSESGES
jgi:hypothetical protein